MYCLTSSKSDLKGDKCWKSNLVTASKAREMKTVFYVQENQEELSISYTGR